MAPHDAWHDEPLARTTPPTPDRRPRRPTRSARWQTLGRDKFRDPDYRRYAQGWRSDASLRDSGRAGYAALVGKYAWEFAQCTRGMGRGA